MVDGNALTELVKYVYALLSLDTILPNTAGCKNEDEAKLRVRKDNDYDLDWIDWYNNKETIQ